MTDFFVCFFPLVKNSERQTKCLPLMMREIMRNSRDYVSCAQHLEVTYSVKKIKKNCSCANDANIKSMPMFDGTNYLVHEKSQINILEERNVLRR